MEVSGVTLNIRHTPFDEILARVIEALRQGQVVLVPTDTVYGLLCMPTASRGVDAIYAMKDRPRERRLPIVVSGLSQAMNELPMDWNISARALGHAFWPGALTIAVRVREQAGGWLTSRVEAAVRAPDHPLIQQLTKQLGPLLMTSANRHGQETPPSMSAALEALAPLPAVAVDGGTLTGVSSTLVNVNLPRPVIERAGTVSESEIVRVLSDAEAAGSVGD